MPPGEPVYRRVLLKLSGEALAGSRGYGIDPETIARVAAEIRDVAQRGVQLAVVIGAGNIFRGIAASTGENVVIRRFARFQVGEE